MIVIIYAFVLLNFTKVGVAPVIGVNYWEITCILHLIFQFRGMLNKTHFLEGGTICVVILLRVETLFAFSAELPCTVVVNAVEIGSGIFAQLIILLQIRSYLIISSVFGIVSTSVSYFVSSSIAVIEKNRLYARIICCFRMTV